MIKIIGNCSYPGGSSYFMLTLWLESIPFFVWLFSLVSFHMISMREMSQIIREYVFLWSLRNKQRKLYISRVNFSLQFYFVILFLFFSLSFLKLETISISLASVASFLHSDNSFLFTFHEHLLLRVQEEKKNQVTKTHKIVTIWAFFYFHRRLFGV